MNREELIKAIRKIYEDGEFYCVMDDERNNWDDKKLLLMLLAIDNYYSK